MIKEIPDFKNLTISIELIDGRKFENKNVPEQIFGENENIVSFWENEKDIKIFPLPAIKEITLHLD